MAFLNLDFLIQPFLFPPYLKKLKQTNKICTHEPTSIISVFSIIRLLRSLESI